MRMSFCRVSFPSNLVRTGNRFDLGSTSDRVEIWFHLLDRCLAASAFALALRNVDIASRRPGEHGAAARTLGLCDDAGLFALVAEEVAEGGEFAAVAAMVPALGLGSETDDAHLLFGI